MPKRFLVVLAIVAMAVAACHSNSGSVSPPGPSSSPRTPSPNPSIKKASVLVTVLGTPAPGIPVQESTPKSTSSPRPGEPFETRKTNAKGVAHFYNLNPNNFYCWVALLGPHQKSSQCASWAIWQTGQVTLGT